MKPSLNLRGTYSGSCIVCLRGTDTALVFYGEVEWHVAALMVLGLPEKDAIALVGLTAVNGKFPAGDYHLPVRVCSACVAAARVGLPAPALVIPGAPLPVIGHAETGDTP